MNRKVIEFEAPGNQVLKRISPMQIFASGTINYLAAHFELSDTWNGYDECYAVWHNGKVTKESSVDADGKTVIPQEVLKSPGVLKVNLCFSKVSSGTIATRVTSYPVDALEIVRAHF